MKSIELFAGIGGMALAAGWAGIETIAFCEKDQFCQKVLKKHWPHVPIFDDIKKMNRQVLEEHGVIEKDGTVDLISGGFPCQPYSIAGKRRGKEDDRDLWPEMFRIIKEIRPTWVVGENVANFANMELDRTLFDLESIGYRGRAFIIPACAVGAEHRRDRVFIVAHSSSKRLERVHNESNRIDLQLPKEIISGFKRKATPRVLRRGNGIPNRVDRIRALGNAVVPQQIYPVFKFIREIHEIETK
ncbi:hypothetical protein PTHTG4_27560 [Parageobacillus thermoglucosidasius]|uniref:DNA cytosine methyltransferase n=1 Tax=Parageobacillus thermoglucosidasius TaxID=1426 RepID=UPI000F620939|nr:DNA (cytosine-5-)-methyltransferase [Parageobacillus thermoglucosidasius]GCD83692.1 hypothetical protein PTHTG4_27560 [Parageobacillus thermoglucosidasius]